MKHCLCWLEETRLQGGDEGPCDGGDVDSHDRGHEKVLQKTENTKEKRSF